MMERILSHYKRVESTSKDRRRATESASKSPFAFSPFHRVQTPSIRITRPKSKSKSKMFRHHSASHNAKAMPMLGPPVLGSSNSVDSIVESPSESVHREDSPMPVLRRGHTEPEDADVARATLPAPNNDQ